MNESVDQFDRALAVDQRRRSNPQAQWSATDSPALSSPYPDTSQPMQFHPIPVYPSQPEPIRHHTPRGPPLERNRSPIQQLPFSNQTTAPTTVVYPPKQHAQTPSHTEPLQPPVPPKHTQIAESPSDRPQPFPEKQRLTWWVIVSRIITCCIPTPLIVGLFKKPREPSAIQAFREKLALCFIILLVQAAVGYITFGFGSAICSRDQFSRFAISDILDNPNVGVVVVHSYLHDILGRGHPSITMPNGTITGMTINDYGGVNMSPVFPKFRAASACFKHYPKQFIDPPCTIPNIWNDTDGLYQACHNSSVSIASLQKATFRGQLFATFKDLENPRDYRKERAPWLLVAYNGIVWNLERLDELWPFISYLGEDVRKLALSMVGKDATLAFHSRNFDKAAECLSDLFTVALLDSEPLGCTVSTVVFWIALVVIASVVGVKFIIALLFGWGMQFLRVTKGAKMGVVRGKKNKAPEVSDETGWSLSRRNKRGKEIRRPNQGENAGGYPMSNIRRPRNDSISAHPLAPILKDLSDLQLPLTIADAELRDPSRMHVLIMVPCYSESAASIKSTLDSVADTTYPATHKSILVVADGIVHGKGNDVPTWESVIDMMELDPAFGEQDPRGGEGEDAMMLPYASLGEGDKCRNQAKVYAGWYKRDNVGNGSAGGGEQQEQQQQQEEGKSNRAKLKKSKVAAQVEDSDGDLSNGPTGTKNSKGHRVSIGPGVQADFGSSGDEAPKRHGTLRSIQSRKSGRIPMILIVKCGNEIEQQEYQAAMAEKEQHGRRSMGSKPGNSTPPPHHSSASAANMKPGNRGKRDSQILLLSFLSKLAFDDKMTELDFELFYKLWGITGVHPEHIQSVLFVDADTQIYRDSLSVLVSTMLSDDRIMGVCGETRIANPFVSWVTMIQVFEYYLSHHYEKAFESFFGTVVCLPGCFSMYRVRAKRLEKSGAPRRKQLRKGGEDGVVLVGGDSLGRGGDTLRRGHGRIGPRPRHFHVPILSSPDIVEEYAARDVSTLHKKNLLLLGEDRYLTTLMLRTFPKRKLVFSPLAVCRTVVPDKFRVLLSQRRRWINSTVHNLLELLLVRDLCGSFCLSMQFVIFMQLIGTVVLPAAVLFLLYLIVTFILARYGIANPLSGSATAASTQTLLLPFLLQFALLGLPAVLLITLGVAIRKPIYIFWMMCWLFAIPIWNFVLPLYAFWNFDDFGWGKTRSVVGENDTLKRRQRKRRKSKRDPETTASENFDATDSGEEGESVSSSDDGSTSSEEDHHDDGVPRLRHTESPIPEEEDGATTAQQASTEPSKHGKGSSISIVTPFGVSSSRRPSQPADPNEPTTTLGRAKSTVRDNTEAGYIPMRRWTEWMRVRRRRAVRGGSVRVAPVAEPAWARGGANLVPVQGGDPFLVQNPPPVLVPVQPQPQPPQLLNQASMPRLVAVPHGMPPPDVPGMIAVPVVLVGTPQLGVRQGPSTSYRASYQGQAM